MRLAFLAALLLAAAPADAARRRGRKAAPPAEPPPAAAPAKDELGPRFERADELLEDAKYEQARAELDAIARAIAPTDARRVRLHERQGAIYLREERLKEARDSFTVALKAAGELKAAGPFVARAYAGLGLCLVKQDNAKFALRFFKRGLDFEPDEGTRLFLEEQVRELEASQPAR